MLKISNTLSLPLDITGKKLAFLGTTGSGKTFAAMKLAEEMLEAGAQIVVLDVVGTWHGLRIASDGKAAGFSIPIFGGLHGDIPLEPTAGALIADLIVDRNISAVLDISQMDSDAEAGRFATAFAKRLFERRKAKPAATFLFLEECQELIPENPVGGEMQTLHAFKRVAKIGRNFGIGMALISQRPQEISKKVLNLSECVFAFQMNGKTERDAIKAWLKSTGTSDLDADSLPLLEVGHAHVWSPRWLKTSAVVKIARKRTFDSSGTPDFKATKTVEVKPLRPEELAQISASMKETIARAKADDPKELRKQLGERDKRILELEKRTPIAPPPVVKEVPVLKDAQIAKLEALAERLFKQSDDMKMLGNQIVAAIGFREAITKPKPNLVQYQDRLPLLRTILPGLIDPTVPARPARPAAQPQSGDSLPVGERATLTAFVPADKKLGKCERAVLSVLAQFPDGCEKGKLTLLAGYRYSGGFRNSLSALRKQGYVAGDNEAVMAITEAGLAALGDYEPLPQGRALVAFWVNHPSLGKAERSVLNFLTKHGDQYTSEQIAAHTGYEYSGGFRNALSTLRTAGLITGKSNMEPIGANPELLG